MAETEERKTYEEMIADAFSRIGFYSGTWTSRSPSDPGITILENLTAFQLVQYNQLKELPEKLIGKWLELLGIDRKTGSGARVLLQPEQLTMQLNIPEGRRFYAENYTYETKRDIQMLPSKLCTVYGEKEGHIAEIQELRQGNPLAADIFETYPSKGDAVYFLFDGIPALLGERFCLYVTVKEKYPRNSMEAGKLPEFAEAEWSYYTEQGYVKAEVEDDTGVFLRSGEIRIWLGEEKPVFKQIGEHTGVVVQCTLTKAEYDIAPRVKSIDGPLFEVYETERKARIYYYQSKESMMRELQKKREQFHSVYVREGRVYREWKDNPTQEEEELCVVCYTEEMITRKDLGTLQGYDKQEFDVSQLGRLKQERIVLMAQFEEGGRPAFCFFECTPYDQQYQVKSISKKEKGEIIFTYDFMEQVVRIEDPGNFAGSKLSLADCAVYHGAAGNLRANNRFCMEESNHYFFNPTDGVGGKNPDSVEEGFARLREWVRHPVSAVCKEDYEYLVQHIPGLCIHKVTAFIKDCVIHVCVKPYSDMPLPELSAIYQHHIEEYLREKRMLNTSLKVFGPTYIPVDVQGIIYVESQYRNCEQELETRMREVLDHVNGSQQFGEPIHFQQVFDGISNLEFVSHVQELKLIPVIDGVRQKRMVGEDVNLPPDGLCYARYLSLQIKQTSIV